MTDTGRLPPGRHGLSRAQVADSQRERMLRAMTEAVAENGYVNTPVAEVLRRAGVSRETFYQQFPNKQECFLAAYDLAAGTLLEALDAGEAQHQPVLERLDGMLARYLDTLAARPAAARTFLVEVYAAGHPALLRRDQVQTRFSTVVADTVGATGARQRFACEALVAAVSSLVTQRVATGRFDELSELRSPLRELVASALRSTPG